MINLIATLFFVLGAAGYGGALARTECPIAAFSCGKVEGSQTKYNCRAATTYLVDHPAELQWRVSEGKILGNQKSYELNVDTARVKSKTITLTLKVHWKNFDRICDKTVTDTIDLR